MESIEQSVQDVSPDNDVNLPAGHKAQSSSSVLPDPVPYRPDEQSMQSDEFEAPENGR